MFALMICHSDLKLCYCCVQSNEVGGSSHMEKEGLVRSMNFLHTRNIAVDTLITDRHPQIQKYVREKMPSVTHYYDVWHTAKGLCVLIISASTEIFSQLRKRYPFHAHSK